MLQWMQVTKIETYAVVTLCIGVCAHHINSSAAWVPVGSYRVPNPEDVVDLVIIRDAVVDDVPQLLGWLGALSTPPEPFAFSLMQWPEQNRHTSRLELLQLYGDGVDILDQEGVVSIRGVFQRGGEVEVCRRRVETRVPWLLGRVVQSNWSTPVPDEVDDASLGSEGDGLVDVCTGCSTRDTRLGVIHEVYAENCGSLADVGGDPVERGLILLTGEYVLPVDAAEIFQKSLRIGVGIWVDWSRGDLMWASRRGGRQSNSVDEIPG